jgi:hypothetical protein
MNEEICPEGFKARITETRPKDLNAKTGLNPVLARLIEEVRIEGAEGPHAYNRQHNRHNR